MKIFQKSNLANITKEDINYKLNLFYHKFQNKNLSVWGLGLEGTETLLILNNLIEKKELFLKSLAIYDDRKLELDDLTFSLCPELKNILQWNVGKNFSRDEIYLADFVIKSPGIAHLKASIVEKEKTICQTEWFMSAYAPLSVGITGSKGKSTTSSLIHHLLKDINSSYLLGNIGISVFKQLYSCDISASYVLELSSHQLEYMYTSPHVAVLTNLFPEHLDHYDSLDSYYEAKLNIARFQNEEDELIFSGNNLTLLNKIRNLKENGKLKSNLTCVFFEDEESFSLLEEVKKVFSRVILIKKPTKDSLVFSTGNEDIKITNLPFALRGKHHAVDLVMAILASASFSPIWQEKFLKDTESLMKVVSNFKGLAHRLEFCGEVKERYFYNDSIATIPESSILALETLEKVDWLVCGGLDRGLDYTSYSQFLASFSLKGLICLPDTGFKIAKLVKESGGSFPIFEVNNMKEVFSVLQEKTKEQDVILLSPAASSYNQYKNFAERGNDFKKQIDLYKTRKKIHLKV